MAGIFQHTPWSYGPYSPFTYGPPSQIALQQAQQLQQLLQIVPQQIQQLQQAIQFLPQQVAQLVVQALIQSQASTPTVGVPNVGIPFQPPAVGTPFPLGQSGYVM